MQRLLCHSLHRSEHNSSLRNLTQRFVYWQYRGNLKVQLQECFRTLIDEILMPYKCATQPKIYGSTAAG